MRSNVNTHLRYNCLQPRATRRRVWSNRDWQHLSHGARPSMTARQPGRDILECTLRFHPGREHYKDNLIPPPPGGLLATVYHDRSQRGSFHRFKTLKLVHTTGLTTEKKGRLGYRIVYTLTRKSSLWSCPAIKGTVSTDSKRFYWHTQQLHQQTTT